MHRERSKIGISSMSNIIVTLHISTSNVQTTVDYRLFTRAPIEAN